jgi:hypothetical protein
VAAAVTLLTFAGLVAQATPATASLTGGVGGRVFASDSGAPVSGATVSLPEVGVHTTSRVDGSFSFDSLATRMPYRRIGVVVTATGWGTWTIQGVPLYPHDTLLINADLRSQPWTHRVLTPEERRARFGLEQPLAPQPNGTGSSTCTGWTQSWVPPPTISVYLTQQSVSKRYDFLFYVQHVLPREWIPSWDADALGAGAIAVKSYGWWRAQPYHAYSGGPGCADLTDWTSDQVFDPTWSTLETDQAVNATFGSLLLRDYKIFMTQYWGGLKDDPCGPVEGQYAGRMSQWGTQTCATQGKLWPDITTTFYTGASWSYLYNLLLDGGMQAGGDALTNSWKPNPGTAMTMIKGGAYNGKYYLKVAPPADGTASGTVSETRPFRGGAATVYHEQVAVRCPPENKATCWVTLRVIAIPETGSMVVNRATARIPNDGQWRVLEHDVPAPGIDHVQIMFSAICWQTFGLDAVTVSGPYGGP